MTPTSIVCFAKDWHEDPTSNHHVMRELARTHRVLWLNSVGTRVPRLSSGRDLGKIGRKLREFARGPVNVENDLWVYSPLVLPMPHSAAARRANGYILRATIAALRLRLGMRSFQLWTFLPNVADYVGRLGEALSVYYCVDEWSLFTTLEKERTEEAERRLLERVDCVFAVNQALADRKRAVNPDTFVSPHGVDHAAFARALDPATKVPDDLASLPRPVIGFYGTLQDWVDYDLLRTLATRHPEWTIALIGQVLTDVSAVRGLPNVHLLGQRPHAMLPAYCKGFDVGIIPYRAIERLEYVNPLKLREYLSAGLRVVSIGAPEAKRLAPLCAAVDTHEEFERAVAEALREQPVEEKARRSAAMRGETWEARVAYVMARIADVATHKSAGAGRLDGSGGRDVSRSRG